jgi:hypothetical protein
MSDQPYAVVLANQFREYEVWKTLPTDYPVDVYGYKVASFAAREDAAGYALWLNVQQREES